MAAVLRSWWHKGEKPTSLKEPLHRRRENPQTHIDTTAVWGQSWQSLFPQDTHLHSLIFHAGVHFVRSVFLTSIPDSSLIENRIELLQTRETYCLSCWDILSSHTLQGGNFPHGATCWVTGQTNKHWELFIFYSHVRLIMEDVPSRTNESNNSTPPPTS